MWPCYGQCIGVIYIKYQRRDADKERVDPLSGNSFSKQKKIRKPDKGYKGSKHCKKPFCQRYIMEEAVKNLYDCGKIKILDPIVERKKRVGRIIKWVEE